MSTEQQLEQLRVQLLSLEADLRQLVVAKPLSPTPAVDSHKYDAYVAKLSALEKKLGTMETALRKLKGQGPAFHGKDEEAFRAKAREVSFKNLADKVDAVMMLCLDHMAELCSPKQAPTVKKVADLAKKLDEFLKMLHQMPSFKTSVGHHGPDLVAPKGASSSPDALFLPLVVAMIVLLRGLQAAFGKSPEKH